MNIRLNGEKIEVRGRYDDRFTIKGIDPSRRWSPEAEPLQAGGRKGAWTFPATQLMAAKVARALPGYHREPSFEALLPEPETKPIEEAARELDFESRTEPWQHQREGVALLAKREALLLQWEMGTGKTKAIVDWICNFGGTGLVLIACPKSVRRVWEKELAKHGAIEVGIFTLGMGSRTTARDAKDLAKEIAKPRKRPLVVIGNYDRIWRNALGDELLRHEWALVVADEIQRIKAPGGKASRFFVKLRPKAKKRAGLTGTLMHNSPLDVYAPFRFIEPAIYGTSFVRFRARYAIMGGYQGYEVKGYQRTDELEDKLMLVTHRVKKEEVLDLPPFVHEERTVTLGEKGRRVYAAMEKEFVADVESGKVTASNALSRLLRLQQITSGFLPVERPEKLSKVGEAALDLLARQGVAGIELGSQKIATGETINERIDTTKEEALGDLLEDLPADEPIVVFCRFRHDLDVIKAQAEKTGRGSFELSGRTNELEAWQDAKGGEVLAVQIQAGGIGVDLTRARYCAYFSLGFSLGDYEQSLARCHRSGQERSVTYFHFVAEGTVDEKVYEALSKKEDIVKSVTSRLARPSAPEPVPANAPKTKPEPEKRAPVEAAKIVPDLPF